LPPSTPGAPPLDEDKRVIITPEERDRIRKEAEERDKRLEAEARKRDEDEAKRAADEEEMKKGQREELAERGRKEKAARQKEWFAAEEAKREEKRKRGLAEGEARTRKELAERDARTRQKEKKRIATEKAKQEAQRVKKANDAALKKAEEKYKKEQEEKALFEGEGNRNAKIQHVVGRTMEHLTYKEQRTRIGKVHDLYYDMVTKDEGTPEEHDKTKTDILEWYIRTGNELIKELIIDRRGWGADLRKRQGLK